jgi:hypothetical protein
VVAILVAFGVLRVIRRLARRLRSPLAEWLRILAPLLIAFVTIAFAHFADGDLSITGGVPVVFTTTGNAIVFLLAASTAACAPTAWGHRRGAG